VDETLTRLNRRLVQELSRREFVALAFGRFEPASGRLALANAGLPDPYLLRRGTAAAELVVPGPRLPLGALPEVAYQSLELTLEPGDRVLWLTDGLPEAQTAEGEPLGYEQLAAMLAAAGSDGAPAAWLDRLLAAVRAATRSGLDDDWTALLLERDSAAAR
jgi:sigma-B regulation protein RsbU (phosphoserine phosphatase)